MTRVECAAFEGLARAVAGDAVPGANRIQSTPLMQRPGDAPDSWTCAVADSSARRPEHRRKRTSRGAVSGRRSTGRWPGAALPSWRESRGGRGRDPLPCPRALQTRDIGPKRRRADCRRRHAAGRRLARQGNASRVSAQFAADRDGDLRNHRVTHQNSPRPPSPAAHWRGRRRDPLARPRGIAASSLFRRRPPPRSGRLPRR